MDTNLRGHQMIMAGPVAQSAPKTSGVANLAKLFFVTLTFLVFVALTGAGVWYFWMYFQNTSYKLVADFLLLITVSNIICQYGLWYWRRYGMTS